MISLHERLRESLVSRETAAAAVAANVVAAAVAEVGGIILFVVRKGSGTKGAQAAREPRVTDEESAQDAPATPPPQVRPPGARSGLVETSWMIKTSSVLLLRASTMCANTEKICCGVSEFTINS